MVPAAHKAANGVCCWCKKRSSKEVHHTSYKAERGQKGDLSEIGVRIFPVCKWCHGAKSRRNGTLHSSKNWVRDRGNPALGHHNSPEVVEKLQFNFKELKE